MSNIYIQEPPTHGKVLLETSVGDIEIELFARETPKASRNFVQLCMENYYDKTKFHRVVKDFIVQGGDPTGTGEGGESIYGGTFRDEFHSRLRFVRRGLVGMANAGKDDNASQFFFTMAPTQELQNKHTLFGKVVGDTIYNMIKLQDVEIGANDRPLHPPKILRTKVLINPFPDIEPRKVIQMEDFKVDSKKPKSQMKATKDYKLLSFGDEAEDDEEDLDQVQVKVKSSHDVLNDPKLSKITGDIPKDQNQDDHGVKGDTEVNEDEEPSEKVDMTSLRDKLKKASSKKSSKMVEDQKDDFSELEKYESKSELNQKRKSEIRAEIKKLKRELMKDSNSDKQNVNKEEVKSKIAKLSEEERENDMLVAFHAEQEKYSQNRSSKKKSKGSARENATMDFLNNFKSKLFKQKSEAAASGKSDKADDDSDDDDGNWMKNTLKFESDAPVLAKDASTKDDDWFDIYDPRNPMNKRRRHNDAKKKK